VEVLGETWFAVDERGTYTWQVVLDAADWQCQLVRWAGPLEVLSCQKASGPRLLARPLGAPVPLREASARLAFHGVPEAAIGMLAREWGVAFPPKADLFDQLRLRILATIPELTPAELQVILAKRVAKSSSEVLQLFQDPVVTELFEKDEKELQKFADEETKNSEQAVPFHAKFALLTKEVEKAKAKAAPKAAGKKKKKVLNLQRLPKSLLPRRSTQSSSPRPAHESSCRPILAWYCTKITTTAGGSEWTTSPSSPAAEAGRSTPSTIAC